MFVFLGKESRAGKNNMLLCATLQNQTITQPEMPIRAVHGAMKNACLVHLKKL